MNNLNQAVKVYIAESETDKKRAEAATKSLADRNQFINLSFVAIVLLAMVAI